MKLKFHSLNLRTTLSNRDAMALSVPQTTSTAPVQQSVRVGGVGLTAHLLERQGNSEAFILKT